MSKVVHHEGRGVYCLSLPEAEAHYLEAMLQSYMGEGEEEHKECEMRAALWKALYSALHR